MTIPKVTVTMMVYNGERYLRQAIESVLGQTFTDFELLVLDDASTDSSLEIVQSYSDSRIRIVRNETNQGVAYSRSKALPLAQAGYVAVLDADDIALPERLAAQAGYLDTHRDVCLVGSAYQVISPDGKVEATHSLPTDPLTIRWSLLFGNCFCHSTVMFRKQPVLAAGGYDAAIFAGEDYDLFVRLAARDQLVNLERSLVYWRRNPESLGNTEALAVKEHFVWAVIRSVNLQTGLEIDSATARCLLRDTTLGTEDVVTLAHAYQVILDVLPVMLQKYAQTHLDRIRFGQLALMDTYRLKAKNPGSPAGARRNAFRILQLTGGSLLTKSGGWRCWLRAVLPQRLVSFIQGARGRLRV